MKKLIILSLLLQSSILSFARAADSLNDSRPEGKKLLEEGLVNDDDAGKKTSDAKIVLRGRYSRHRAFVGTSAGFAAPLSGNPGLDLGGGINFSLINFGYRFGQTFGFTATTFATAHQLRYTGDKWNAVGLTVGPMASFSLHPRWDLDIRPMVGLSATSRPYDDWYSEGPALTFLGSTMLRFHTTSRFSFLLNTDVLWMQQKFRPESWPVVWRNSYVTISLNAGIAYRFM